MKKTPETAVKRSRLTLAQTDILIHLGRYRFLTASQLVRLGVATDRSNLNKQLAFLRNFDPPLIESANYGVFPKIGRLENVHCLTPKGRSFLLDVLRLFPDEILPPATGVQYHKDYFHRLYTIDFEIALDRWAKENRAEIVVFDLYFDRVKGQKGGERAKTKLDLKDGRYLIADGIFMLQTANSQSHLYCLEVYNGQDLGRTMRQLRQHVEALALGTASTLYGHDKDNRVLCIFEEQALLDSVRETLHSTPFFQKVRPYFLLKPLSEIQNNERFETWVGVDGRPASLL